MKRLITVPVWFVMEWACRLTGHRVFACWNGPGNRLWFWAYTDGEGQA